MKCENCGNEHDGSYGSGRFCSKHCRCSFNAKKQKHFATKEQLLKRKGFGAKAKEIGWKCDKCNITFRTRAELRLHLKEVKHLNNQNWNKGLTKYTNSSVQKSAITLKQRYKNGELISAFKGKHHSDKSKNIMRIKRVKTLEQILPVYPNYNHNSIPILEAIAKEHGWNIQHAENGGEFYTGIGYFVDAYDKEKNIVLEFDEKNIMLM